LRRSGERADRDWHVVAPSVAVDDVREQERAPFVLGQSALELSAHERMQLCVLIDRPLDADQQPMRFERRKMRLEVERGAGGLRIAAALVGLIEHCIRLCHFVSRAQRST